MGAGMAIWPKHFVVNPHSAKSQHRKRLAEVQLQRASSGPFYSWGGSKNRQRTSSVSGTDNTHRARVSSSLVCKADDPRIETDAAESTPSEDLQHGSKPAGKN